MEDLNAETVTTDVLRALALQIRFLSVEQLVRGWLPRSVTAPTDAVSLIDSLHRKRLIERTTIEVRHAEAATKPLFAWKPAEPDPRFERWTRLAADLAARWSDRLTPVEVIFASASAANLFGAYSLGTGRPCEWSHDFRLTEAFLHYRKARSQEARAWRGEAARRKWGKLIPRMKDPDAMLIQPNGSLQRIIEVAGVYSAEHLAEFHRHCAGRACERLENWQDEHDQTLNNNPYRARQIGYELW